MPTTRAVLFISPDNSHYALFEPDLEHKMAEVARSFWPDPDLVARGDEEALETFAKEYKHCGYFTEPFFVPVDVFYILDRDEARTRFEEVAGRPPTDSEYEAMKDRFTNAIHECGLWDVMDESIRAALEE